MNDKKEIWTQSTHFILGKDKQWKDIVLVSPNLAKVFRFLVDISEELDSFLNIDTSIWNMKKKYSWSCVGWLGKNGEITWRE
jgi:hypothetical protein